MCVAKQLKPSSWLENVFNLDFELQWVGLGLNKGFNWSKGVAKPSNYPEGVSSGRSHTSYWSKGLFQLKELNSNLPVGTLLERRK